jgi:hypothetical protein
MVCLYRRNTPRLAGTDLRQPERVKSLEIFFSNDKKSGDFTKSSENELI